MYPVDDLFAAYAKSFEANREAEMTLPEYLEACRDDPMMFATATERLLAAIGEPQMVDTAKDAQLGRIFMNRTIRVYPAFSEFFGMEETIERIVGFLRHAAQGLEERKQIMYLLGPVGGGKSSLAERLKALMELHPVYVLKAGDQLSPVFESPLGLFNPERMGPMLEDRFGIPQRRLTGLMSPWCVKRLDEFEGDISRFRVAKLQPSRLRQIAVAKTEPGDENNQDISSLVGKVDIRKLEVVCAGRSGRLQLFGRPVPREPRPARIRRNVQGADQGAAPVADRNAGRQLQGHGRIRRHPVQWHRSSRTRTRRSGRPSRTTGTTKPS